MTENVSEVKARLRTNILSSRDTSLSEKTAEQFGKLLIALCQAIEAKTIGIYLSFGSEPATDIFVQRAKSAGLSLAAPRTGPEYSMEFGFLEGPTKSSSLGFLQPVGEVVDPSELDLVIAPALSVDRHGTRLGRGGGFFDRYLEEFRGPVAAVVFDAEFVSKLPVEPHDKPVNFAVTQSGIHELPLGR
jgi:5-formyltetrahydrofolate cyclo-ligase